MSISVLHEPPGFTAALWRRLVAMMLISRRARGRRDAHELGRQAWHDIGLNRNYQGYAPRGRSGQASIRELHARAERLAAGLPE